MKDLESESLVHDNFLTVLSKCNVSMWNCKITFQLEGFEFLNCIFTSSLIYHTSMLFVLLKKKKKMASGARSRLPVHFSCFKFNML